MDIQIVCPFLFCGMLHITVWTYLNKALMVVVK
jgi:hypothetical protein